MREKYRESIQPSENCVTYMFNKKEQYEAVENAEKVNIFTFLPAKTDNIMDYKENDKEELFTNCRKPNYPKIDASFERF